MCILMANTTKNGFSLLAFCNRRPEDKEAAVRRVYPPSANNSLGPFFDDRTAISSCDAYRRLGEISQLISPLSNKYKTRATHTDDVIRSVRDISRRLSLCDQSIFLGEAIAAAHDIGHLPFTHYAEIAAQSLLGKDAIHFHHDRIMLDIVTKYAKVSSDYDGLNLTLATLEGLTKRFWHYNDKKEHGHYTHQTIELPAKILEINGKENSLYLFESWNHTEGQVAAIADWVAHTASDVYDSILYTYSNSIIIKDKWKTLLNTLVTNLPFLKNALHLKLNKWLPNLPEKYYSADMFEESINDYLKTHHGDNVSEESRYEVFKTKLSEITDQLRELMIKDVVKATQMRLEEIVDLKPNFCASDVRTLGLVDDDPKIKYGGHLMVGFSEDSRLDMVNYMVFCRDLLFPEITATSLTPLSLTPQEMMRRIISSIIEKPESINNPSWQAIIESAETPTAKIVQACNFLALNFNDDMAIAYYKERLPDYLFYPYPFQKSH